MVKRSKQAICIPPPSHSHPTVSNLTPKVPVLELGYADCRCLPARSPAYLLAPILCTTTSTIATTRRSILTDHQRTCSPGVRLLKEQYLIEQSDELFYDEHNGVEI